MEIENLLDMDNSFHIDYKDIIIKEKNDAITVAGKLRNDWKLGEDAISNITFLLEENGIKVIHLDAEIEFDELSGFINKTVPVIIVNKNTTAERQRFTALHELGHLLLNFAQELQDKERERLCNIFANEMLIPTSEFIRLIGVSRKDISLQELIPIQMQFGISIDALMYKAKEAGIITEQRYKGYCIKKNSSSDCNHSIFRHDDFIGCFSADKIKKSVRKYFCFNITIYKNMAEELSCRKPFPKEYIQTSASGNPEDLYH